MHPYSSVYKSTLKRENSNVSNETQLSSDKTPNTVSGEIFMRKRSPSNGPMDRDNTVTQSLLTGQTLVIRRETTTSDDMIVFNDRLVP